MANENIQPFADAQTLPKTPAYNTYVGARYVPLFDGAWDNTKEYEPLTVVSYGGDTYTSKTYVPKGVQITNENYWAVTGNFNAQVETYREEVRTLGTTVTNNQNEFNQYKLDNQQQFNQFKTQTNAALQVANGNIETNSEQIAANANFATAILKPSPFKNGAKVLVIGDSIADPLEGWVKEMEAYVKGIGGTFLSKGVGGATLDTVLTQLDGLTEDYDYIITYVGVNSLNLPKGSWLTRTTATNSFAYKYNTLTQKIQTVLPSATKIFCGIAYYSSQYRYTQMYSALIRGFAKSVGGMYIDMADVPNFNKFNSHGSTDGLHPTGVQSRDVWFPYIMGKIMAGGDNGLQNAWYQFRFDITPAAFENTADNVTVLAYFYNAATESFFLVISAPNSTSGKTLFTLNERLFIPYTTIYNDQISMNSSGVCTSKITGNISTTLYAPYTNGFYFN